ncbi:hypothetical protein GcC1_c18822o5 [Golovinomyces cichoracearum]|uniref:Secreted protein n=1 Tax=Golovinomyces cichoracearum TaxID=62708 RepID=A0A420IQI9_9PEZI|nr:hypothetical protein GcC1_c18822o5 [Golovinomyces cichoracearum]
MTCLGTMIFFALKSSLNCLILFRYSSIELKFCYLAVKNSSRIRNSELNPCGLFKSRRNFQAACARVTLRVCYNGPSCRKR